MTNEKEMREIVKACVKAGLPLYIADLNEYNAVPRGRRMYDDAIRSLEERRNAFTCCALWEALNLDGEEADAACVLPNPDGEGTWYLEIALSQGEWSAGLRADGTIPAHWVQCNKIWCTAEMQAFRIEWMKQMREEFNRQVQEKVKLTEERKDEKARD